MPKRLTVSLIYLNKNYYPAREFPSARKTIINIFTSKKRLKEVFRSRTNRMRSMLRVNGMAFLSL